MEIYHQFIDLSWDNKICAVELTLPHSFTGTTIYKLGRLSEIACCILLQYSWAWISCSFNYFFSSPTPSNWIIVIHETFAFNLEKNPSNWAWEDSIVRLDGKIRSHHRKLTFLREKNVIVLATSVHNFPSGKVFRVGRTSFGAFMMI
jgi:hypothetical protein